jgi:hypothetical protein
MSRTLEIESEVPFGRMLNLWLCLKVLRLDDVVRHDRMEAHYLAWETVRKQLNPFFHNGSGFEGYLIGRCTCPEAALDAILSLSQDMLDGIARLYPYQFGFQSRLINTLIRGTGDSAAIHIWSDSLGAELGKLRAQILCNREALAFQWQTYNIVKKLPTIHYHESKDNITQTYAIGLENGTTANKISVTLPMLKPNDQDAWLVAENIGKFGHPLVRNLLDHI